MGVGQFGRWAGVAAVAASLSLGGCAALDAAAVAETHRLEEGEFYVDVGSGGRTGRRPHAAAAGRPRPGAHRRRWATARRAAEFAPLLAAVNADLQRRACCTFLADPTLPPGAPHVYVGSAVGEFAPPEGEQQVLPQDQFPPMVLHLRRPSAAWQQAMSGTARTGRREPRRRGRLGRQPVPQGPRRGVRQEGGAGHRPRGTDSLPHGGGQAARGAAGHRRARGRAGAGGARRRRGHPCARHAVRGAGVRRRARCSTTARSSRCSTSSVARTSRAARSSGRWRSATSLAGLRGDRRAATRALTPPGATCARGCR